MMRRPRSPRARPATKLAGDDTMKTPRRTKKQPQWLLLPTTLISTRGIFLCVFAGAFLFMIWSILRFFGLFVQHDVVKIKAHPRVGAYYYAWYEPKQWEIWKTKFPPELGLYPSQSNATLSSHSKWARQAGIDFFLMSWSDKRNHENVLHYLNHPDTIPITLHIESMILYLDSRVNRTAQENGIIKFNEKAKNIYTGTLCRFGDAYRDYLFKAMDEIVLPYRHKYLFVGDRPVFVLYLAREFFDFENDIYNLRQDFYQKYGVHPYLIADVVWFLWDHRVRKNTLNTGIHAWDAITAYNRYEGRKTETLDEYMERLEVEYDKYSNPDILKNIRLPVVPYVQPGYDDLLIRAHEHGPNNATRPYYERNNGMTYHKFWDQAERILGKNPCSVDPKNELFIFVCSFNEWHESTSIEPSTEWKTMYLDITRQRKESLKGYCTTDVTRTLPKDLLTSHQGSSSVPK